MTTSKILLGTIGFAGGIAIIILIAVLLSRAGDPVELVEPVAVAGSTITEVAPGSTGAHGSTGGTTTAPTTAGPTTGAAAPTGDAADSVQAGAQVLALEEITGVLTRGDDLDDYEIGQIDLDLGPEGWIATATAPADYDGDGQVGTMVGELDVLLGSEVTMLVQLDGDRDDADVYVIDGMDFRDVAGGPAPWQAEQAAAEADLRAAAEAAVGEGARSTDLDRQDDGGWEVEVIAADGRDYDVRLSAAGEVLSAQLD